jgi:hypothetical protein
MGLRDHIPGARRGKIGDAGRRSEKLTAKSLGARLRPASGAMEGAKGDMVLPQALVEAKSTTGDSISIKYSWLGKITQEAFGAGKYPALTVTFTDQNGRPVNFGQWVMIPLHVYQEMAGGR